MTARAPYRFAPIGRWVHVPDWGKPDRSDAVSHDDPLPDGLSGAIELEIEAKTPLLIGGARRESTDDVESEVWPLQLPDGRWAIPGSSLQGHFRSILEIAAFGSLGRFVEERRFGVREIGGTDTAKALYLSRFNEGGKRIVPKVKAGWLFATKTGAELLPCKLARIHLNDVWALARQRGPLGSPLIDATKADERLEWFWKSASSFDHRFSVEASKWHEHGPEGRKIEINYSRCAPSEQGEPGTVVLAGKTKPGLAGNANKKWEFVFHAPARAEAAATAKRRAIAPDVWRDFRDIHDQEPGRPANAAWQFWRGAFDRDEPIPVFYLEEDEKIASIGMAYMFKVAHRRSTYDLLAQSAEAHVEPQGLDFASLIFGQVAPDGAGAEAGLKRRASFDAALAAPSPIPEASNPTVLLGPKPNFYPAYVRQPGDGGELPISANGRALPHASYTPIEQVQQYRDVARLPLEQTEPELAGAKLWPAWGDSASGATAAHLPPPPDGAGAKVQTRLRALPAGATFKTTLRFHNLRPVELGALLWAINFSTDPLATEPARHRLGMGKPYGLGSATFSVTKAEVVANAQSEALPLNAFAETFARHMAEAYKQELESLEPGALHDWSKSAQVRALQVAAQPNPGHRLGMQLYMGLGVGGQPNADTYRGVKARSLFLPVFEGGELPRRRRKPDRRKPGGASAASSAAGAKNGGVPSAGKRVRMNLTELEGKIQGPHPTRQGEWLIEFANGKIVTYKASLFTVIA